MQAFECGRQGVIRVVELGRRFHFADAAVSEQVLHQRFHAAGALVQVFEEQQPVAFQLLAVAAVEQFAIDLDVA